MGNRAGRIGREWIVNGIIGLGVALGALLLVEVVVSVTRSGPMPLAFLAGVVTSLPFLALLVGGGYWLSRSELPADRYRRVGLWTLAALSFFVFFFGIVALVAVQGWWTQIGTVRWGAAVGAGSGFLVGTFEARAIEQARAAERAEIRANEATRRRELLDYLNALLRHEVLNTANVIEGYASLLEESDPDEVESIREYGRIIRRQADGLADITDDVRVLLAAADGDHSLEPVDLSEILREEVTAVDDRHQGVEPELMTPDEDVFVLADDLLRRLFENLLSNAVQHNDSEIPHVEVTVEQSEETVTVRIADDGPGIPESERDGLFDYEPGTRASDHGLGLSIVSMLAERYGGDVRLTETGPDGSEFTVRLQRATGPSRSPDPVPETELPIQAS